MAQLHLVISLDNIPSGVDANQISDLIENAVKRITGMDTRTTIYDNDGVETSNPIMTHNVMRKIKG